MDAIIFVYKEDGPINYRQFVEWLFKGTPNLKKNKQGCAMIKYCEKVVMLDLELDQKTTQSLFKNAIELGLINKCGEYGTVFSDKSGSYYKLTI